jgi:hypothetical protein
MKQHKGSAIIIAIIIITFISTIVIGSSQIFLKENSRNVNYLDGLQSWFAAYSGLDLLSESTGDNFSGSIDIRSDQTGKRTASINSSKSGGDVGESLTLSAGKVSKFSIDKLGAVRLWFKGIDTTGEGCPDGNSLYVYLKYSIDGGTSDTLNKTSQIRGNWPDTYQDNSINLYLLDKTLAVVPVVSDKFLIDASAGSSISDKCEMTTLWKVSAPAGSLTPQTKNAKSTGSFGDIAKTLSQ